MNRLPIPPCPRAVNEVKALRMIAHIAEAAKRPTDHTEQILDVLESMDYFLDIARREMGLL